MTVEIIVLCCYFVGMISMGLYWNKRAKSSEDYMLGGRSMGPLVTALTLQTTAMRTGRSVYFRIFRYILCSRRRLRRYDKPDSTGKKNEKTFSAAGLHISYRVP